MALAENTTRHSTAWHEETGYHLVRRWMVKRRKSTVLPPPPECPLDQCMRLLAGAWTADVIWYLREGKRCFTELQTDLKGVSAKMLTTRLRKLEREGVIERGTRATSPPTVWYVLTPAGQELCGALSSVVDIAQRLKRANSETTKHPE
jgi:DNA-binding HxlR family transcriptional regulator